MSWRQWAPYVPVARRRAEAARWVAQQGKKKGVVVSPVVIEGRQIARSFWGKAWCDSLQAYSDYSNRLPRGRTYVRNGSVVHLKIESGAAHAHVSGSTLYTTSVHVQALQPKRWKEIVDRHASKVGSVVDLLQGRLPKSLLEALADRSSGLFPPPKDLKFACSCPDYASMCKHVAAVLYGVGARLDTQPELFFLLRGVEVSDLAARGAAPDFGAGDGDIATDDLGALFGIEMATPAPPAPRRGARAAGKGAAAKGVAAKGVAAKGVAAKGKAAKGVAAKGKAAKGKAAKGKAAVAATKPKRKAASRPSRP